MGFHGEALLAPRPTPKLEDHPSSAVRDCLFNLFAATAEDNSVTNILLMNKENYSLKLVDEIILTEMYSSILFIFYLLNTTSVNTCV